MKHLILCCALLAMVSCQKNTPAAPAAPQLPAATQTGANTFGCKINGKVYILDRKATNSNPIGITANSPTSDGYIYIGATSDISLNFLYKGSFPDTCEMAGKYPYYGYYWDRSNGTAVTGSNEYKTNAVNKGAVTITFYNGAIISGTFWFDGANDSGKIVHVTDGRFDITL